MLDWETIDFVVGLLCGLGLGIIVMLYSRSRVNNLRTDLDRAELESSRISSGAQVFYHAIRSSPNPVIVVDRSHTVVASNSRAQEFGLVKANVLNDVVWGVVVEVFEDQDVREFTLTPKATRGHRPVLSVKATAQMLSLKDDRFVVVHAIDDSEQVRMNEARRDFVANVSHELKTPVGAMSLMTEALLEVSDDQESVEYFGNKISAESHRMGQMITELISLSKLQGAEQLPNAEVVDIDAVVDEAIARNSVMADAAGVEIITDPELGAQVKGDLNLLVTSLSNLIVNAINYSPEKTSVSISRQVIDDEVTIRVTDRGIGISKENQKRVFERFYRVDKARSRNTGGTGLGLSIVKHVMANHGGTVELWSREGTGSTFTMRLPAYYAKDDPQRELAQETADENERMREAAEAAAALGQARLERGQTDVQK